MPMPMAMPKPTCWCRKIAMARRILHSVSRNHVLFIFNSRYQIPVARRYQNNTIGFTCYELWNKVRPRKKIVCFRLTGCQKKVSPGRPRKIFFFILFRNIVVLFYSFFYLDSIQYIYLKWFISVETSSWYICSIFKTCDNFFQYILIPNL